MITAKTNAAGNFDTSKNAQLNPGPNIVLIGRQILIGRFFFKFVNGTNGFFKINIYI